MTAVKFNNPARRVINRAAIAPSQTPPASQVGNLRQPTESGEKVTVLIPKNFILTLDDGRPVPYSAGVDEMPLEHAHHWYSKALGVEVYNKANT